MGGRQGSFGGEVFVFSGCYDLVIVFLWVVFQIGCSEALHDINGIFSASVKGNAEVIVGLI